MSRAYPGFFLTLEGPEGCGKTSQIPPLVDYLRGRGISVYPTREPGGTPIGEKIRDVIHSLSNIEIDPRTETLLYQAARAQIVAQEILPRLKNGELVICDRFYDSTIAYQVCGHRQEFELVKPLIEYATGGLKPDLTVLLDLPIEVGLERKKKQDEWNRMDGLPPSFHRRVRAGYLQLYDSEPERFLMVDASKTKDEVFAELSQKVEARLVSSGFLESVRRGPERR